MKDTDVARLREQVKAAWASLPPDVQAQLHPKMRSARVHALALQAEAVPDIAAPPPHRELVMLDRVLHEDDQLENLAAGVAAPEGILTHVLPDGEVQFGGREYDWTDPGWAYCFVAMVATENSTPPFNVGNVIQIPDDTTLAILGDWGGANEPALAIAAAAAKSARYQIHLGDVYYAGTTGGSFLSEPYEPDHFIKVWTGQHERSFALNSNHDMYAHATGYSLALQAHPFTAQGGNCFALYNKAYRIVGLDSAYYAPDNRIVDFPGYLIGSLGKLPNQPAQFQFLEQQIADLSAGQKLILLTHHNGLNLNGSLPQAGDHASVLWQQVTEVLMKLPHTASKDVLWYWGHQHVGAVYKTQTVNGINIQPRCCGHGCMPWGIATDLNSSDVLWSESQVLGPGPNYFVTNGYATLTLNGASLTETFWDQNGKKSWSQP
jgi:hypothetical protein